MVEKTEFKVLQYTAEKDGLSVKLQVEPEVVFTIEDTTTGGLDSINLSIERYGTMTELIQECILEANGRDGQTLFVMPKKEEKGRKWPWQKK